MGKKELKRDLKLYVSDNSALADEAIMQKARAVKAEVFIKRLIEKGMCVTRNYQMLWDKSDKFDKIPESVISFTVLVNEWNNREAKADDNG